MPTHSSQDEKPRATTRQSVEEYASGVEELGREDISAIVGSLLFKPVPDDYDFKATGKHRHKHWDGGLWAQIGGVYQITIQVNEDDIKRLNKL